jgi:hypothetical protein
MSKFLCIFILTLNIIFMATRSYIGIRNTDASVDYIYCHFDGYPSGVGATLVEHYADMDKVNALMKLGDLSVLGNQIGGQQDFNDRSTHNPNWCLAYGRDRNEPNTSVKTGDYSKLINDHSVDYVYVFDGDYWECFDTYGPVLINLYKAVDA